MVIGSPDVKTGIKVKIDRPEELGADSKETGAAQAPPVRNLEAFPLMRYNNCQQLLYH